MFIKGETMNTIQVVPGMSVVKTKHATYLRLKEAKLQISGDIFQIFSGVVTPEDLIAYGAINLSESTVLLLTKNDVGYNFALHFGDGETAIDITAEQATIVLLSIQLMLEVSK